MVVPRMDKLLKKEIFLFEHTTGYGCWRFYLDRLYKMMKSGRSVPVALRRRVGRGLSKPLYVIDITIDPEGSLPWLF
jgi:hypothetical protein